jgi:hypothetical protein
LFNIDGQHACQLANLPIAVPYGRGGRDTRCGQIRLAHDHPPQYVRGQETCSYLPLYSALMDAVISLFRGGYGAGKIFSYLPLVANPRKVTLGPSSLFAIAPLHGLG